MKPGDPKYRVLFAVWAFLECLGFGGLIYGWVSLVYILKDEGLYLDLCDGVRNMSDTVQSIAVTVATNITGIVSYGDVHGNLSTPGSILRSVNTHCHSSLPLKRFCYVFM